MDVKVTATGADSGPIDWDIDGKKPKDSSIHFKERTGPHSVKFKLDDRTGRDLRFDPSAPFWSHESETGCPPPGSQSGQTEVTDCRDKVLMVTNRNSGDPCTIHYQLNFVDGRGVREVVDPEFKNGGGGCA